LLEPKGMAVNSADVAAFRRVAQDKVWPAYKQQFPRDVGGNRRDKGLSGRRDDP